MSFTATPVLDGPDYTGYVQVYGILDPQDTNESMVQDAVLREVTDPVLGNMIRAAISTHLTISWESARQLWHQLGEALETLKANTDPS